MDRDELLQVATQLLAALLTDPPDIEASAMIALSIDFAKDLIDQVDRECPPVKTQPPSTPMDGNPLSHIIYTDDQ